MASPLRYALLAALLLAGLAALASQGASLGLLPALLLLPLAGVPAWLALAHLAATRAAARRAILRDGARPWWAPLLGGALWAQVLALPVALGAAWSLGWALLSQGAAALGWALAAAALTWPAGRLVLRQAGPLRPFARLRPVLRLAPLLVAAALTGTWMLLALAPGHGTLAAQVAAAARYEGASALLAQAVDAAALATGARAWAEGWAGPWAPLWRLGAAFGQFWLLALVFAGLLLPPGEARRVLRPSDADAAPPVGPARAAAAGFLAAVLSLAAVTLAARGEGWAAAGAPLVGAGEAPSLALAPSDPTAPRLRPARDAGAPGREAPARLTPAALRAAVEAERLGELACPEGTIAGLEALDRGMREVLAAQRARVGAAAGAGFDAMRANVPAFLDWYYSLPAEYARTGHLLAGDAGDHLAARLGDHLDAGDPLGPLTAALEDIEGNPGRLARWREARAALLGPCADLRLPRDAGAWLVRASAPEAVLLPGPTVEALDLEARLTGAGGAAVAGGLAGGLLGKTLGKLVAKEAFGLAAEALGKLAIGKAAGWLGGAAAGAGAGGLAGSVVPGVGTTVGAAVGGVVGGLGAWIATDYALLALDEAASREGFQAEILAAIDEAEAEFLASLGAADPID